ncbi:VP5 [CHeRI orbivirus 1]|nr:VP5 [CHeRI orbivirus 1]
MGKFTSALSRIGRGIRNVATSDTTRRIIAGAGNVAARVLESETGQKVVAGVVQGLVESAVTEGDTSSAIKKAIIGNVLNIHEPPVDPLNPTEQVLASKVAALQKEVKYVEEYQKHEEAIDDKIVTDIEHLKKIIKNSESVSEEEEDQVKTLQQAMKVMLELSEHEIHGLQTLNEALGKESKARSRNEAKIVEALKSNYSSMLTTVRAEKEAIMDEALEQIVDLGGEISEHLAAEVPLIGESIAAGMASARGVQQIMKLSKTINKLTGIDVNHMEVPAISPLTVETVLMNDSVNDAQLQRIIQAKLKHVEEVKREVEHINESVSTELIKKAAEEGLKTGNSSNVIHHTIRSNFHVPRTKRPGIHIYTSPYDSDYVMFFLVVSPYSMHRAFIVCIDLLIDFVSMQDVYHGGTRVHKGSRTGGLPSVRNACKEFYRDSVRHIGSSKMHAERMARSTNSDPLYVTSMGYPYSFAQTRRNAEAICKNAEIQKHLLRGPLNMQRKSLLNALMHGVTIVAPTRSRSVQQGVKKAVPVTVVAP